MTRVGGTFTDLVNETPMLELKSLSAAVGVPVFGKCEFMSVGGSVKDRPVKKMLDEFNAPAGALLVEATAGNTGSALAQMCAQRGLRCLLTVPEKISPSKIAQLRALGAEVVLCDSAAKSTEPGHFIATAVRLTAERGGLMLNQFDNPANRLAHHRTAAEIVAQVGGTAAGLVVALGSGTGGTAAGIGEFLHGVNGGERAVVVIATQGQGVVFDNETQTYVARAPELVQAEALPNGTGLGLEGVGPGRMYGNLVAGAPFVARGVIGGRTADLTAAAMCRFLVRKEGVFVGGSAGLNCAAAVLAARLQKPRVIATILCDGGERYLGKMFDDNVVTACARACGIAEDDLQRFLQPNDLSFMNEMLKLNGAEPF